MNCRPKASEEPAGSLRTSQRNSKNKKKARPKSPTPSDSQMSDATGTGSKPRPDELYEIFNPWYLEAPKELLDRTVSRQPFTQRYWSLTACVPGCCIIHRPRNNVPQCIPQAPTPSLPRPRVIFLRNSHNHHAFHEARREEGSRVLEESAGFRVLRNVVESKELD